MSLSLQDTVALVTGAASGIGSAICTKLAEAGATIVASDLVGVRPQAKSAFEWVDLDVTRPMLAACDCRA